MSIVMQRDVESLKDRVAQLEATVLLLMAERDNARMASQKTPAGKSTLTLNKTQ